GGVSGLNDLTALKAIGVDGIIVGKALLEGRFTVAEALQCLQDA
ncbi:MAG: HisA/HisF-related TIM barrel protein, partial [Pseudomonadota bacterium]